MSPWDLNAIVLAHANRFFQAARRVTPSLQDKQTASLVSFAGNMLWAHSAFADVPKDQERAMAVVGGAASSFADKVDLGGGERQAAAEQALDELERELLARVDPLVDRLMGELSVEGLAESSPGVVNAWVWNRLFSGYPWAVGQGALEAAISARLT